ncbi:unnamed protein product [Paramecium sonneborni]|uniref:Uncharacterized protein n=1 Tax=Paramecium sonneborni TaxID=65129 RepID=A0A8S1K5Y0_9CILI|nr:unnamed protein product [Paramecium sonneborni]CAD8050231.1 unnamed protein product [Paramecium sonneborni]
MISDTVLLVGIIGAAAVLLLIGIFCIWRKLKIRTINNLNNKPMPKAYVEIPDKTDRQARPPTNPQQCSPKGDEDSIAIKRKVKNFSSAVVNKKKNLTIKIPTKEES